ncbi:DinB family protein [Cellulomonas cellasea]|uniref:Putative damage-inducible protein DinB n=1 Tax=Cellulomonas cellasea TaxID=43670 RepID=A0A7W4UFJ8_9CELL|nr:DinB family protein [Cellulomonas cellasea]MBB2923262.1 putative damage-inducible protein DinB [Cellulomonas cellasea]
MTGDVVKAALHDELRWTRASLLGTLDGLTEYDARRPLTETGTNLLGLVKHLALTEARYLGEILGRPFAEPLPRWDDSAANRAHLWAAGTETREEVLARYARACAHADATIDALPLDAPGHVPWWPSPEVRLVNLLVHVLVETARHTGHADILREGLDGAVGTGAGAGSPVDDTTWEARARYRAQVEAAARAAAGRA